jgi:MFS superfamily sulfate permease-like transporter
MDPARAMEVSTMDNTRTVPGLVPIVGWLRNYPKAWLRPDLIAGLNAAAVVIPKAMAYAAIAGLPLQVGLYTVLVPMVLYAVLGTSRPLSVSTTTTIAILAAAQLGKTVPDGAPATVMAASATLACWSAACSCWRRSCAWASSPTSSPSPS